MINELLNGLSKLTSSSQEVATDTLLIQFTIVTASIVGKPGEWVLVDTGLENSADYILKCTDKRFGESSRPKAIILTHGHFDHVGSVNYLAELWDVPVYSHELELPYITGKKDYPEGDPSVDEGLVAKMSPSFPNRSINLGHRAVALPSDGSIPGMPGWKWIHTPGHTEGHISLYRESDKTVIVGDAFTTTKQESFTSVLTQHEQIKGPPAYLTTDWVSAKKSIDYIKGLNPRLAILSHGHPIKGDELARHLDMLVNHFNDIAVPDQGRFVDKD
ncbi:MBL fold metallo-hydrolase [Pseudobacteroides cellulosolvens]|uniref:Beta-lactamase domain protein n=1 Tax=Pseudobacteroides cellulosolvens ATCC 35603 = DSM 2933 TaxID=398512 RepID=A0A0L6JWU4_9FIRM|nr:MBL fold metallo-hydrolase [Pseudobacteroides cellulosolvens]KNY29907.1 beta-lactamase domain protein [Pseudobacteroides cellulosolvens ATCC 35603 = DSM 2933]